MIVALVGPYPTDPARIPGGVPAVTYYFANGLAEQEDIELHVIAPTKEVDCDSVVHNGNMTIHYLPVPKSRLVPNLLTNIGRIQRTLAAIRPDVVHSETASGTLAGIKGGYPTIHTIHGITHREIRYGRSLSVKLLTVLESLLSVKSVRGVKHCIAVCDYAARAYAPISRAKMHRIFNPVEDRFFDMENREVQGKMFSAAVINRRKNALGLVRAFDLVHQRDPMASLFICGKVTDHKYFAMVEEYVRSHNLEGSVNLLGFVSQDELYRHFCETAVVCLFSFEETAPVIIAQAMCAGKPVVASAAGGTPDLVVDGETGFIVDVGDEKLFAERSIQLLSDARLRHDMGQRTRQVAEEHFRTEIVVAKTRAVYQEALDG